MSHKHLTPKEREIILTGCLLGETISEIAGKLGRNKSSISRELSRNRGIENYSAVTAQMRYIERRKNCRRKPLLQTRELQTFIKAGFEKHWSPEEIVGRWKLPISVTTIYRGIHAGLLPKTVVPYLRRKGRRYVRRGEETRGHLVGCIPISQRAAVVEERLRLGDWEGDTVLGTPGSGGIVTLVDRKSGMLLAAKIEDKRSDTVTRAIFALTWNIPLYTITVDNGREFAGHQRISAALKVQIYFTDPHAPWQRGTNENTNGLIREFLPKGMDFRKVDGETVKRVVNLLNNRPRKRLAWKTPAEVFYGTPLHLI